MSQEDEEFMLDNFMTFFIAGKSALFLHQFSKNLVSVLCVGDPRLNVISQCISSSVAFQGKKLQRINSPFASWNLHDIQK